MDKIALVGLDLEKGSRILQILDDADLRVTIALWAVLADYGDWRLILSSRKFDAAGPTGGYGILHDTLDAAGMSLEETPIVGIFHTSDPFIRALRKNYRKARSGMHIASQLLGERFVEDAYAYRIS